MLSSDYFCLMEKTPPRCATHLTEASNGQFQGSPPSLTPDFSLLSRHRVPGRFPCGSPRRLSCRVGSSPGHMRSPILRQHHPSLKFPSVCCLSCALTRSSSNLFSSPPWFPDSCLISDHLFCLNSEILNIPNSSFIHLLGNYL